MMQSSRILGADADAGIILNIVTDSVLLADAQWIVVYANPSTNLLLELEDLHADAERKRAEGAGRREDPQGNHRLAFVSDQRRGLDYLSLDRSAETISGGEAQRIRLASQIGSGLTGVMYVLDEPSIGLHQRDNARLLETLTHLRDLGNTVIVVEHDLEAIEAADYVVDMGPGAGEHGGHVVAEGTPAQVAVSSASLIGAFLSGRREIVLPARRTPPNALRELRIREASGNNLKRVDLQIPVAC